ncbi:MAG: DUF6516 family protein [archaeon]|nr:DUF6516 family protein [archaeon]MDI6886480.1 DUF6516 family protein [archaeon]
MKEAMRLPRDEKLIAIAYLVDSSVLHIRERYKDGELIKYSYHLMKGDKVIRWDNVPHHKEISTYPHHKHENDKVKESNKMGIGLVLEEIKNFSFTKKPLLKK